MEDIISKLTDQLFEREQIRSEQEQIRQRDRRRNRQIEELTKAIERPTVLPSTKRWIQRQIELLKRGAAA
jgi:hypothetical protein